MSVDLVLDIICFHLLHSSQNYSLCVALDAERDLPGRLDKADSRGKWMCSARKGNLELQK